MPETPGRPSLFAERAFQAVTALLIVDVAAFVAQEHSNRPEACPHAVGAD
jgi:hypothetical protein